LNFIPFYRSASKVYGLSLFLKMSWTFYEQFSQITDDEDLEDPPDLKHVDLVIKVGKFHQFYLENNAKTILYSVHQQFGLT